MIPIPNVNGDTLEKVIEFCTFQTELASDTSNDSAKNEKQKDFNQQFLQVEQEALFDLILVSTIWQYQLQLCRWQIDSTFIWLLCVLMPFKHQMTSLCASWIVEQGSLYSQPVLGASTTRLHAIFCTPRVHNSSKLHVLCPCTGSIAFLRALDVHWPYFLRSLDRCTSRYPSLRACMVVGGETERVGLFFYHTDQNSDVQLQLLWLLQFSIAYLATYVNILVLRSGARVEHHNCSKPISVALPSRAPMTGLMASTYQRSPTPALTQAAGLAAAPSLVSTFLCISGPTKMRWKQANNAGQVI